MIGSYGYARSSSGSSRKKKRRIYPILRKRKEEQEMRGGGSGGALVEDNVGNSAWLRRACVVRAVPLLPAARHCRRTHLLLIFGGRY